jgi:integrase
MSHIRQKGKRWYIVAEGRDDSGRRTQKWSPGFASEEEARRELPAFDAGSGPLRFGPWLEQWHLRQQHQLRVTTWAGYRRYLDKVPLWLQAMPLEDVTGEALERAYAELREGGWSGTTCRQLHAILKRGLGDAVQKGRLTVNPAAAAASPRRERPQMQTWSPDQLRRFLRVAETHEWKALWVLAVTTGLRRGELLGLQRHDLEGDVLRVRRSVTWDGHDVVVSRPKTASGERLVGLDPWTAEALREHLVRLPGHGNCASTLSGCQDMATWLFSATSEPPNPHRLNREFTKLARAAGLPAIRFHDLRHSHATMGLHAAGVPLAVMSQRLGHSDPGFTARVYQHADVDMQRVAAEAMAALLFEPTREEVPWSSSSASSPS